MKSNRFYLANGTLGLNVVFWVKGGNGYTTDLDRAHIYSHKEMQEHVSNGWLRDDDEFPLCADRVDALAVLRVDMQIVTPVDKINNDEAYCIANKDTYSGNDIELFYGLFASFDAGRAINFDKSYLSSDKCDLTMLNVYKRKDIDKAKRRTFPMAKINKRKMIVSAGIVGVRKKRVYKSSGKTRWNCPVCGKISWQYNPYDFDGCKDFNCEAWEPSNW